MMTTMPETPHILVVDDDPVLLAATERLLTKSSYAVDCAENGLAALEKVEKYPPDLVLLDVMLPDIDGLEVCRQIKKTPGLQDVPVILLSGVKTGSDKQADGLESGADDYISRPISNRELLARVRIWLRLKQALDQIRASEEKHNRAQRVARIGHWELDSYDSAPRWSEQIFRIFGLDREAHEPSFTEHDTIIYPEEWPLLDEAVRSGFRDGSSFDLVFRILRPGGEIGWLHAIGMPEQDNEGRVVRMFGTAQDITDLQQTSLELQVSEKRFQTLFETMAQGVVYQNADGTIIDCNSAAERILGLSLDQMKGLTSVDPRWHSIHPDGTEFPGETHPSMVALDTGKPVHDVVMGVFNPQTETYHWININAVPQFRVGETRPYQVFATFEDITHRIEYEAELRQLHDQLSTYTAELEQRVAERTGQLEKRIAQVDQMNLAMANLLADLRINQQKLEKSQADLFEANQMLKRERVQEQMTLLRLSQALIVRNDVKSIANLAVRDAAQGIGVEFAALFLVDEDGETFSSLAWFGWPDSLRSQAVHVPFHADPACTIALSEQRPVVVPDTAQAEFDSPEFLDQIGIRSRLIVPLVVGEHHIGGMVVNERDPHQWTEDEIRLLSLIANTTAQAIERARLFEQVLQGRERLQVLSRRLIEVQENERHVVARELHDQVGQVMTALKLHLQMVVYAAQKTPFEADIHEAIQMAETALQQVRNLSRDLRPSVLDDFGLVPALRWHLDQQALWGSFSYQFEPQLSQERLPESLEVVLYRIVQSALTNTVRHAQAKQVDLRIWLEEESIRMELQDDGVGFDVRQAIEEANRGMTMGLLSMMERAELLGGQVEIESEPGRGTRIKCHLPLDFRQPLERRGEGRANS
jgi:PAS domain S-box-containing protein